MALINIDDGVMESFLNLIREIVRDEVVKSLKGNYEKCIGGTVLNSDNENKVADIKITGNNNVLENIRNYTGEDLNIGDMVKVYDIGNTDNDKYIGLKI